MSRDTLYRYQELVETDGLEQLINRIRRTPNLKIRVNDSPEHVVIDHAIDNPAHGQHRSAMSCASVAYLFQGVACSRFGFGIYLKFKCCLKALKAKVANEGIALSDEHIAARCARTKTTWPTVKSKPPSLAFSVRNIHSMSVTGIGRIYQQTFIDTCSKVVHCNLYTTKTLITAADVLNDKVLPFYASQGFPMLSTLTDRSTAYCDKVNQHDYQLYLAINDIDHTRTNVMSPPRMASANDSLSPFCKNITKSPSVRSFWGTLKTFRKTWMHGSSITIMKELIKNCATAECRCKLCSVGN